MCNVLNISICLGPVSGFQSDRTGVSQEVLVECVNISQKVAEYFFGGKYVLLRELGTLRYYLIGIHVLLDERREMNDLTLI